MKVWAVDRGLLPHVQRGTVKDEIVFAYLRELHPEAVPAT